MSKQLAISAAFSVMAMAAFTLLDPRAAHAPLAGEAVSSPLEVSAPALPELPKLLPFVR